MKFNSIFKAASIVTAIICFPVLAHAAPGDPGPGPVGAPFDGGITMVIAAGVAYASKKAYDKRKMDKKKNSDVK
jgi:hypothetical protein